MEDRKLTEKESLQLISQMIINTRRRIEIGDSNILLLWGLSTVIIGLAVYTLVMTTNNPGFHGLWGILGIVGFYNALIERKRENKEPQSYTDRISKSIWNVIGSIAIISVACSFICQALTGIPAVYGCMIFFALIIIGLGVAMQGIVIKERSMVIGGTFSVCCGMLLACLLIAYGSLYVDYTMPILILCYTVMMVVPGFILRSKAKRQR